MTEKTKGTEAKTNLSPEQVDELSKLLKEVLERQASLLTGFMAMSAHYLKMHDIINGLIEGGVKKTEVPTDDEDKDKNKWVQ